jgi:hypothetical protein
MGIKARFDARQAEAIRGLVDALAGVPSRAAPQAARAIRVLIGKQFTAGRDPFGRPWRALRPATLAKGRHPPPLTDTAKMRRGIRVFAKAKVGIAITVPAPPGQFHQFGTRKMARRQILPLSPPRLPPTWRKAIERATRKAFDKAVT